MYPFLYNGSLRASSNFKSCRSNERSLNIENHSYRILVSNAHCAWIDLLDLVIETVISIVESRYFSLL